MQLFTEEQRKGFSRFGSPLDNREEVHSPLPVEEIEDPWATDTNQTALDSLFEIRDVTGAEDITDFQRLLDQLLGF